MSDPTPGVLPRRADCSLIYDAADLNGGDQVRIPNAPLHDVQDSETLSIIAKIYHQDTKKLCEANPQLRGLFLPELPTRPVSAAVAVTFQKVASRCDTQMVVGNIYFWTEGNGTTPTILTVKNIVDYEDTYSVIGDFETANGVEGGAYYCPKANSATDTDSENDLPEAP